MNDSQAVLNGQLFIDTFLNSYKKANGVFITRSELMSKIYKYEPQIKFKEWGRNFDIALNSQVSELVPKMDYLAEKTKGGLPSVESFTQILSDSLPTQFEIITTALKDSAVVVGDGLVAVGDAAISAGAILVKLFPFVVVGVVAWAIYSNRDVVK